MQKLQEHIQRFGTRQIELWVGLVQNPALLQLLRQIMHLPRNIASVFGHIAVIVHNDILRLGRLVRQATGDLMSRAGRILSLTPDLSQLTRQASEALARTVETATGTAPPPTETAAEPEPPRQTRMDDGHCVYAIGDVHGRCDLLEKLLDQIDTDTETLPPGTQATIVFLGDYIDRGLQSRQVVELIMGTRLSAYQTVFLMGNHEEALLRFRDDAAFGAKWARYGGVETLLSYGLQPPPGRAMHSPEAWHDVWDKFRERFPVQHVEFFQSMKHYVTMGDYLFVHAGLRPNVPMEEQTADDMMWIRDEFLHDRSMFPYLVVHGHTPTPEPFLDNRRLGLDTGAFSSGVLTAARFIGEEISILQT